MAASAAGSTGTADSTGTGGLTFLARAARIRSNFSRRLRAAWGTGPSVRAWKRLVFAVCLLPFVYLAILALTGKLGVNPIETITLFTGRWTLRLLLVTLAVTPVRRLFGWNRIIQLRRMLGLFAFFYASLHLATYVVLDQFFHWPTIVEDVTKRPFIMAGMTAFLLLTPLAVTSTGGWIRRLGRRWATLHTLVYPAAIVAVIHFIWKVKSDLRAPTRYAVVLAALLAFRLLWKRRKTQNER